MDPRAHSNPAHGTAEAAELEGREQVFPRQATSDMLAQAEAEDRRRGRFQVLLVAAGLAAVCLGLPNELPWGEGEFTQAIAGERTGDALALLGKGVSMLFGLSADHAAYLLSALFLTTSLLCFYRLLADFGFDHFPALGSALTAVLAPVSFVAGTSAMAFSAGSMTACALARSVLRGSQAGQKTSIWAIYTVAWLLYRENLILLPACWVAVSSAAPDHRKSARIGLLCSAFLGVLHLVLTPEHSSTAIQFAPIGIVALLGSGILLLAVIAMLRARRADEESPPPRWILVWLGCALVACLLRDPRHGPAAACLLPIGAIAVADWISRQQRQGHALRVGVLCLAGQIVLTAIAVPLSRTALGRDLPWVEAARQELEPTDLLLGLGERASFFLRHRFGLEVWELSEAAQMEDSSQWAGWKAAIRAQESGRRVFFLEQSGSDLSTDLRSQVESAGALQIGASSPLSTAR